MKFTGKCNWCGKPGHKEHYCFAKKRGEPRKVQNNDNNNGRANANTTQNSTDAVEEMFS